MLAALWAMLLAAAPARAGEEAVGTLAESAGTVRLLRGENYLDTQRGVEVFPQDIVETGANGSAQIDLKDGSVLKLGPGSRLALTDYKLDKNRNVVSATVDVLTGWLRFAVSKLRKDDSKYRINAPSLTIGIRGTEGVVEAGAGEGGVHLVTGRIEVGGQDAQGKPLPAVQVNAGEYIQRLQGQQTFRRLPAPPPSFQNRVPQGVVRKLAAMPLKPGEHRIIKPRVVRKLTPAEAQQFIQRHPHARDMLKRRFQPLLGTEAPGARQKYLIRPDGDGRSTVGFGDGERGRRLPGPDGGRLKGPPPAGMIKPPIQGGIGGQLPRGAVSPGFQPVGVKPVPGQGPGPGARMLPGGVPVLKGLPVKPDGKSKDQTDKKKPEGQSTDSGGQSDNSSSPPPKPPAAPHHPPPRKVIRMLRQ
ncbi:MAG: hypothetical protein A2140_05910 [Candidatus Muproteobacteria bacterium RBG_16_62_13]|uniref:FecR protein domain-containing protein n=1 Tax=Candidatus Muproteobacteria bacterium RBG_16_62_13 TaxID=1817756 RepID=A0A1F6T0V8_9PROT|nr:MAG: hypothetical protein A2140_05910 [Candidatus Muproteobacteria bacterium RBG_16_62_13]